MTPKWMGWETVREIGSGSFGKVYEIQRTENGQTVSAALKVISIPESEQEINELYDTGMADTEQELDDYIESLFNDLTSEVETMIRLKDCMNIVRYDKHMTIPHTGWKGMDILIKMELLTPLNQYMPKTDDPDEKQIIKLGFDICNALSYCHSQTPPILHRDIKPGNIMVDKAGNYKLGDFGVARVLEGSKSAHTKVGTESYMAPEVLLNTRGYGVTADIYSLGMMLYRLLNRNRVPFVPTGGSVSFKIMEEAQARRLSNEAIPLPAYGSNALKQAIMKAVEFEPERRYQSAEEFGNALRACLQGNSKGRNSRPASASGDDATVKVAHGVQNQQSLQNSWGSQNPGGYQGPEGQQRPQASYQSFQGGYQGQPQAAYEPQVNKTPQGSYGQIPQGNYPSYDNKPAKKKSKGLIALIAVIAVVLIAGGILAFTMLNKKVTMSWLDYDGSTITEKQVKKGTEEDYEGELPSRAEDEDYTYEFTGWDKAEDAEGNVTYTAKYAASKKVKIGDIITFGSYEQDNNSANGKEAIEWIVLDKKDNSILVISRYALDCRKYNSSYTSITWEKCTLRSWLNKDFYTNAFSSAEQGLIATTKVTADKNPNYSTDPGNDTQDKIFLLSITEAEKYFQSNSGRQCKPTAYAIANGAYVNSSNCYWWLRSPGLDSNIAADVDDGGSVRYFGNCVHADTGAVRPALWINLES